MANYRRLPIIDATFNVVALGPSLQVQYSRHDRDVIVAVDKAPRNVACTGFAQHGIVGVLARFFTLHFIRYLAARFRSAGARACKCGSAGRLGLPVF